MKLVAWKSLRLAVSVGVVMGSMASTARADGIVLESYTGSRPDDATRLLAPLHEELDGRGYLTRERLSRLIEANVSRPALSAEGLPPDFGDRVDRGHKAWIAGLFDDAVAALGPAIEMARANSGAFAQNQALRNKLLKAQIALALSQQRKGDLAEAKSTFGEVLRSFPDAQVSRAKYGPDAYELFESVRKAQGSGGRGRLVVKTPVDSAVVFVNEKFENVGTVTKPDMVPGEYRTYVRLGKEASRVHRVTIERDRETTISIDPAQDAALHTTPSWSGFVFANADDRERLEARYAVELARAARAGSVVVVGFDDVKGRPSLVGALVDLNNMKEIRRASLALEPEPSVERIHSLARFLAGDASAADDLDVAVQTDAVTMPAVEATATTEAHAGSRRWMRYTGIAAIAVGAVSAGVGVKFGLDARDYDDELTQTCAVSCTPDQARVLTSDRDTAKRNAIITGSVGVAAIATGVVLLVLSREHHGPPAVALTPTPHGAVASMSFRL
jgi:hypothetical protein